MRYAPTRRMVVCLFLVSLAAGAAMAQAPQKPPEPAPAPTPIGQRLVDLLASPRLETAIPVRLVVRVVGQEETGKIRAVVLADVVAGSAEGAFTIGYVITDRTGGVVGRGAENRKLAEGPDGGRTLRYGGAIQVRPGSYTLRMVAIDGKGQAGSAEAPFEARMRPAGPLQLGELFLLPASEPNLVAGLTADGLLASRNIRTYMEIVPIISPLPAGLGLRFELAETEAGRAVFKQEQEIGRLTKGNDLGAATTLDLAALKPGRYYARTVVLLRGRRVGQSGTWIVLPPAS